jgi:uncharacterized membrane protein YjjB (DUF3815 family)
MLMGLLTGSLSSALLKLRMKTLLIGALLGALGSTICFLVFDNMPWQKHTITTSLGGRGVGQITMNRFQHPEIVAFAVAALLPILHQFYRFGRLKSSRAAAL